MLWIVIPVPLVFEKLEYTLQVLRQTLIFVNLTYQPNLQPWCPCMIIIYQLYVFQCDE